MVINISHPTGPTLIGGEESQTIGLTLDTADSVNTHKRSRDPKEDAHHTTLSWDAGEVK